MRENRSVFSITTIPLMGFILLKTRILRNKRNVIPCGKHLFIIFFHFEKII